MVPPRAPAKLSGNIFSVVVGDTRRVSFSPYDNIDISFLATTLEERSPSSSLNFKINACRLKQATLKALQVHLGDSISKML